MHSNYAHLFSILDVLINMSDDERSKFSYFVKYDRGINSKQDWQLYWNDVTWFCNKTLKYDCNSDYNIPNIIPVLCFNSSKQIKVVNHVLEYLSPDIVSIILEYVPTRIMCIDIIVYKHGIIIKLYSSCTTLTQAPSYTISLSSIWILIDFTTNTFKKIIEYINQLLELEQKTLLNNGRIITKNTKKHVKYSANKLAKPIIRYLQKTHKYIAI